MAEAVQPVPVLENIPTSDKETKIYMSPYARALALTDKVPVVVSDEIALEPSGRGCIPVKAD